MMKNGTAGTLTYVRRNITVPARVLDARSLYTVIIETGSGRRHRIPTTAMQGESHYGYVKFGA